MTVQEAAEDLGLSVEAIRARVRRGDMQAERDGARVWLIPRGELERWRARGKLRQGRPKVIARARDGHVRTEGL